MFESDILRSCLGSGRPTTFRSGFHGWLWVGSLLFHEKAGGRGGEGSTRLPQSEAVGSSMSIVKKCEV